MAYILTPNLAEKKHTKTQQLLNAIYLLFSGLTYAQGGGEWILSSCFPKHDKNSISSIIITLSTREKFYYVSNCFIFIIKIVPKLVFCVFFFYCLLPYGSYETRRIRLF